eukprot:1158037-Pelagomonas_calceolata.AAC.6
MACPPARQQAAHAWLVPGSCNRLREVWRDVHAHLHVSKQPRHNSCQDRASGYVSQTRVGLHILS